MMRSTTLCRCSSSRFSLRSLALSKLTAGATVNVNPPKESFKMATSVITMGPIIILYPFLQKYFVKGMVVGAVKG